MATQIQLRRDTAANWTSNNPTLAGGELGYETDTTKFKIGDGATAWTALAYNTTDLTGLATETYVGTQLSNLVDSAPVALDTLNELAAALGDDANFAGTVTTALSNKANTADLAAVATSGSYTDLSSKPAIPADVSDLTDSTNLLDHFSGSYTDLSNKPSIPTNNTELTNGAGYITGYTVTESDVTGHQAALAITESQITDLTHFSGSYTDLTSKPTIPTDVSNLTDTTNLLDHFSGSYTDLTSKPTIPTNNTELTNGAGYITGYTVTESDVTGHQAALSITESQISDLTHFSGSYTDLTSKPTIPTNNTELSNGAGYITGYTVTESDVTAQQAALSITESQISDLGTYLTAETNDLSSAVTWANVPDANITAGSVTQHQGALSITESQISDLGAYITGVAFADVTAKPTTVAGYGITDAASTAQGNLADSALQSGDNISELVNNSAFITASALTGLASETYVGTQISNLVDTAPETLNTLNELAAALGDDANFATTTATALGNKANTADLAAVATSGSYTDLSNKPTIPADVSNLTDTTNLLDHFSGAYADLSGKPTIPTNNTELTNGAGYITGYTVSEADVTGHQGALSITESQISDLGAYITGVAFADVSAKPTTISGYGITDAFSGVYADLTSKPTLFSGSYTDLTDKATIPTAITDLSITDGTDGQVLTTDGAGGFTFTTVSGGGGTTLPSQTSNSGKYLTTDGTDLSWGTVSGGGGGSTGDLAITGTTISTATNADLYLTANGTGIVNVAVNGAGAYDSPSTGPLAFDYYLNDNAFAGYARGNRMHHEQTGYNMTDGRLYGNAITNYVKLDGTSSNSSNDRIRNVIHTTLDVNGATLGQTSTSRGATNYSQCHTYNTGTSNLTTGTAGTNYINTMAGHGTLQAAKHTFTNLIGAYIQTSANAPSGFDTDIVNATALQLSHGYDGTRTNINYTGTTRGLQINSPYSDSVYANNNPYFNNWIGLDVNNAGGDRITGNRVAISYNGSNAIQNSTIGDWGLFDGNDYSQNKISSLKIHNNGNSADVRLDRYNDYGGYIYIDGQRWPSAAGSDGQYLKTDASGNLSWVTPESPASSPFSNASGVWRLTSQFELGDYRISGGTATGDNGVVVLAPGKVDSGIHLITKRTNDTGGPDSTSFANIMAQGLTYNENTLQDLTVYAGDTTKLYMESSRGNVFSITLTDSLKNFHGINTLTYGAAGKFAAPVKKTLIIKQDATGSRIMTFNPYKQELSNSGFGALATVKWKDGINTLSTAANAIDILEIFYDGVDTYYIDLKKGYV